MGFVVALILSQALSIKKPPPVRIDRAIASAKKILTAMGAQGLRLQGIALYTPDRITPMWSVGFSDSNRPKGSCQVELDAYTCRIGRAECGDWTQPSTYTTSNNKHNPDLDVAKKYATSAIRIFNVPYPLRLKQVTPAKPVGEADFSILIEGKRFFNFNPMVGYMLHFDVSKRQILNFLTYGLPSKIEKETWTLSPSSVQATVLKFAKNSSVFERAQKTFPMMEPVRLSAETEQGYFDFRDNRPAQRVWLGTVRMTRRDQHRYDFPVGEVHCLIDGQTGTVYPYTDRGSEIP